MLKWLDSPRVLFILLRAAAVLAIIAGVWLSLFCGIALCEGAGTAGAVVAIAAAVISGGLWVAAWVSFAGMCTRLIRGGTAFTRENSRSLRLIGVCVVLMAAVTCLRALPALIAAPDVYLVIEAIILPGMFLTIGVLAFILRRLLERAMSLEAEQADVI